jgi:phosphatidylglycerophosphate synthase
MRATPSSIVAVQVSRLHVEWYFLLKASPYLTTALIRLGLSANATTVLWGTLNVGTAVLVYLAICGRVLLAPVILMMFAFSEILDNSDGEIARYTGTSSPIGGKLLDGIAHKATEFALAAAYACGAAAITRSPLALPIGVALLTGEGLLTYCYERRLLILRLHMRSVQRAGLRTSEAHTYVQGTHWLDLPLADRLRTITGLISYKSVYAAILIAALSPTAFLWALAALAIHKHTTSVRLVARTVRAARA